MKVSDIERRIMIFIQTYQRDNQGMTPTQKEIQGKLGYKSKRQACEMLANMESKGLIERATLRQPIIVRKETPVPEHIS